MQAAMRGMFPALKPNYSSATSQFFFFFSTRHFSSKLFIRGLPFSMTDQMLADAFSEFGKVVKAEVIKDKDKKKSKGFGYVTFDSEDEAQKALRSTHGKINKNDDNVECDQLAKFMKFGILVNRC